MTNTPISRATVNRRDVLRTGLVGGAGYWLSTPAVRAAAPGPADKLNIALVGLGGQGTSNLKAVAGQNVVALCDVDDERAGRAYASFPQARKFYDYRQMFDAMANQIDAVVVSTPDHSHFHPSWIALQLGKHLYCEKPLAHSVWEARQLTQLAAKNGLATQLGVQRHALENVHRVVETVQSGLIGQVQECHSWIGTDRGMPDVPTASAAVPDHLRWDLWLGPAASRPYSPDYCPYKWRFWWDFGTGETGNWGCHILDLPFWALDLKFPTRVEAEGPPIDAQRSPRSMTVRFDFPQTDQRPAVKLHWYHAKDGPPILRELDLPKVENTLFVGSEGMLLCGFSQCELYPKEKFADVELPQPSIPSSPGFHEEWFASCRGEGPATCDFSYGGPLTETALLGNVAYRAGGGFDWNAAEMTAYGNSAAPALLVPKFRRGWEV